MVISGLFPTLPVHHFNDRNIRNVFTEVQWLFKSQCVVSEWSTEDESASNIHTASVACLCWHPVVIPSESNPTHLSACPLKRKLRINTVMSNKVYFSGWATESWWPFSMDVHVQLVENHPVCSVLNSLSIFVSVSFPLQQQSVKAKEATDEMELSILKTCQSVSDLRQEVRFLWQATHRDWIPWAKHLKQNQKLSSEASIPEFPVSLMLNLQCHNIFT